MSAGSSSSYSESYGSNSSAGTTSSSGSTNGGHSLSASHGRRLSQQQQRSLMFSELPSQSPVPALLMGLPGKRYEKKRRGCAGCCQRPVHPYNVTSCWREH